MNVLILTDDQLHHLIDVLDEVLRQEEPNYTEWCSAGNDPTDHLWYRMANVSTMLDEEVAASDASNALAAA